MIGLEWLKLLEVLMGTFRPMGSDDYEHTRKRNIINGKKQNQC